MLLLMVAIESHAMVLEACGSGLGFFSGSSGIEIDFLAAKILSPVGLMTTRYDNTRRRTSKRLGRARFGSDMLVPSSSGLGDAEE